MRSGKSRYEIYSDGGAHLGPAANLKQARAAIHAHARERPAGDVIGYIFVRRGEADYWHFQEAVTAPESVEQPLERNSPAAEVPIVHSPG